jgi:hypothetical protein
LKGESVARDHTPREIVSARRLLVDPDRFSAAI